MAVATQKKMDLCVIGNVTNVVTVVMYFRTSLGRVFWYEKDSGKSMSSINKHTENLQRNIDAVCVLFKHDWMSICSIIHFYLEYPRSYHQHNQIPPLYSSLIPPTLAMTLVLWSFDHLSEKKYSVQ